MAGRIHGLAVWSPHRFATPHALPLPASRLPGRLPRRRAQIVQVGEITFANVHLSHGQLLNRRQLARIAAALRGKPSAIIGDYNAVGPVLMPGFSDVGPREPTHFASNVVPFRLDRCLVQGCAAARPARWPSARPTTGRSCSSCLRRLPKRPAGTPSSAAPRSLRRSSADPHRTAASRGVSAVETRLQR